MSATEVAGQLTEARDAVGRVVNPLGDAVNTGLDALLYPFVWPLLQVLEMCVGDPDQLDQHARTWHEAAASLRSMAARQQSDLARLAPHWQGEAAAAYAARIGQLVAGLESAAEEMARTADGLGDSATDLRSAEEVIRTIIRELVEWLVLAWVAAQVLAAVTAGASEAAAAVASAAQSGIALSRTTRVMAQLHSALEAYKAFMNALKALGTVGKVAAWTLDKLYGPKHWIKAGLKFASGVDGSIAGEGAQSVGDLVITSAADEYDDRQRGDDGDSSRLRRAVSGIVDPLADRR